MDFFGTIFTAENGDGGVALNGSLFDTMLAKSLKKYTITVTLTNGTVTGDETIQKGKTATIILAANEGYQLPALADISITGATIQSYNTSTGELVIANPTFNVSIVAACVVASYTITTTVTNGTASGDESIEVGGTASVTVTAASGYALPSSISVSGATYTYDSTTGVIALSAPTGAVTIAVVCEEASSYPVKGDIIGIDMDGDGTDEEYLVLKTVSGSVVEVLARVNSGDSAFASSGQVYAGGTLDTALNTTYYNTLSATAKAAIVDKTFRQDSWYRNTSGNPDYNGSYSTTAQAYYVSLGNASFGNEISRHIYALSVQDIIDYLEVTTDMTSANSTLNMANVQEMFNITSGNVWLRSAKADDSSRAMNVNGDRGYVNNNNATNSGAARPAFQIDLSKIAWTPSNS